MTDHPEGDQVESWIRERLGKLLDEWFGEDENRIIRVIGFLVAFWPYWLFAGFWTEGSPWWLRLAGFLLVGFFGAGWSAWVWGDAISEKEQKKHSRAVEEINAEARSTVRLLIGAVSCVVASHPKRQRKTKVCGWYREPIEVLCVTSSSGEEIAVDVESDGTAVFVGNEHISMH